MHPVVLLQLLAYFLIIAGFIVMFAFRHHLLLNSHTPTARKTLGVHRRPVTTCRAFG